MPRSSVKAKISAAVLGCARSAASTLIRTPCDARSLVRKVASRRARLAVSTRCAPPAANSSARAAPIPELAPVTSAHFPHQGPFGHDGNVAPGFKSVQGMVARGYPSGVGIVPPRGRSVSTAFRRSYSLECFREFRPRPEKSDPAPQHPRNLRNRMLRHLACQHSGGDGLQPGVMAGLKESLPLRIAVPDQRLPTTAYTGRILVPADFGHRLRFTTCPGPLH